jgi:hypothetical protein
VEQHSNTGFHEHNAAQRVAAFFLDVYDMGYVRREFGVGFLSMSSQPACVPVDWSFQVTGRVVG